MFVSIAIVRALAAELGAHSVDAEALCAKVGLDPALLKDPAARITLRETGRVVREAMRITGHDDLGLRVAAGAPAHALHVVGHMLVSARTLRQAIDLFFRYAPLVIEGARYELSEAGELAVMRFDHPLIHGSYARFAADLSLAFMHEIGRALVGPTERATLVRFRHERPKDVSTYEKVFECPVEFGADANEIVFEARFLDREHVHTDEQLLVMLQRRADDLLARIGGEVPIDQQVRELLGLEPELTHVEVDDFAQRLGLAPRTLQRRLRSQGLSWSAMVEEEQRVRACAALAGTNTPIKEIAYRIGFSEPSAFHRAFKRWTGMTPSEYRRAHEARS